MRRERVQRVWRTIPTALLGAAAVALAATAAQAGFPGSFSANQAQQFALRFVCADAPATQCLDLDFNGFLSGIECPAPAADPVCVPDFVGGEIRGVLTVVSDNVDPGAATPAFSRVSLVFDFRIGDEAMVLADTFDEDFGVGGWFPYTEEDDAFTFDFAGGALFEQELGDLGDQILAVGQSRLGVPAGAIPVISEGIIVTSPSTSSQDALKTPTRDASAPTDETASVARYRITVRFVPLR
jgi:hypothetical protein